MKFFTAERYLRLQDPSDRTAWMAASEDWDRAVKRYWEGVSRMLEGLPKGRRFADLRRFLKGSLHDALVLANWTGNDRLTLVIQPERPETKLLILTYALAGTPTASDALLADDTGGAGPIEWMYDEVELTKQPAGTGDPVFTHRILLSTGVELTVRFTRFNMSRVPPLPLASSAPVTPTNSKLSQTA